MNVFEFEVFDTRDGRTVALVRTEPEANAICTRNPRLDYESVHEAETARNHFIGA